MSNEADPIVGIAPPAPLNRGPLSRERTWEDVSEARPSSGYCGEALAATLLRQLFSRYPGALAVRLWRGEAFCLGVNCWQPISEARFVLVFRHPQAVSALVLGRDPLRLAEAYFRSDIDVEGDLFSALELKRHLPTLKIPTRDRFRAVVDALRLRAWNPRELPRFGENVPAQSDRVRAHSREESRRSARFHYDISNDFYRLWLGRSMVYSCGYFETPDKSIEEAQFAKLDHICKKLQLRPNETFLDIDCGWGGLLIHAASEYGVRAHGITLSRKQFDVVQRRIEESGLAEQVTVELKDYRDLSDDAFDKVASVGMLEHVGLNNMPVYWAAVSRVLKPGGLFLNHGITQRGSGWRKSISTQFVNRFVFPDAQLDNVSCVQGGMEAAQFEIEDVESLRVHYALTLRSWAARLEQRHHDALDYVSEATYRVWRVYLSACAIEFETGNVCVYQILASKRGACASALPLTRHHLYRPANVIHQLKGATN